MHLSCVVVLILSGWLIELRINITVDTEYVIWDMQFLANIWSSTEKDAIVKNVKFSHTCHRAFGPELILIYGQSAPRWLSHPPGSRLSLLFTRPAVTFPAEEHHCPLAGTKLYCLVTEAYACEQLAQGCYPEVDGTRFEPATFLDGQRTLYRYVTQLVRSKVGGWNYRNG